MNNLKSYRIIDNRGEQHELMLIIATICSLLTFKRIKKLERYKNKLKGSFTPY
ncbi:hypothetical protein [Alkalibacillus silvisoli]|uniref:Transposase n=1 Tax=Alkalibacillus silvisoli TaxID=392823 RepID=A0ABN0ZN28_9BACI